MQIPPEIFYPAAVILGLCLGSFYNVCIHRFLSRESIIRPGSKCPLCGHKLSWWENIPVLSYILLRARCRSCGRQISLRYPAVEILSSLFSFFLALKFGPEPVYLIYLFFFGLLIIASFIDLDIYILPDMITIPGTLLALAASPILPVSWTDSLLGAILGGGVFFLIQRGYRLLKKVEGLGTGDIKFMFMLGALTGWQGLPILILSASSFGLLSALYFLKKSGGSSPMQTQVPFGPFLALGAAIYILWGESIWAWYLG